MPVPSAFDRRISEISDLGACVVVALQILHRNPNPDPRQLRERLQAFVDAVTETANDIIAQA